MEYTHYSSELESCIINRLLDDKIINEFVLSFQKVEIKNQSHFFFQNSKSLKDNNWNNITNQNLQEAKTEKN